MSKPSLKSLTEGLPPAYWLLWSGTLVNRLGTFVVPFLSLYLTVQRQIPVSQSALMVSLFGAGSFISQLMGGELSDRLGRRPVMLTSFLVTPAAMLTLGLAHELWLIAACTFILGFFTDLYRPAVNASVADLVAPEARTRGYGYIYWAINFGAAIAPVLAGLIASYSYLTLFIADALTTLVFGLLVLFGFHETRPLEAAHHAARANIQTRFSQLKRAPVLLFFSVLTLFFGMVYAQSTVTLPLDMAAHGLSPEQYGLTIAINGFMIILTTIPVSNMAAKWPRFPSVAIGALFLGLGFGFTALASNLMFFMISVAIWTVGEIVATSVAPTIIADLSPIELRGLFQGIFGSAWGLAYFLGPLVGGWIYENFGSVTLWGGSLVIGLLMAFAYFVLGKFAHAENTVQEEPA
ncbi:MAG TPA: MFS transporter [Anaerolineales bacterium]|nr:MFS transporter [Anaerolineales bacterium]